MYLENDDEEFWTAEEPRTQHYAVILPDGAKFVGHGGREEFNRWDADRYAEWNDGQVTPT